jgi:hypothetical protein
LQQLPYYIPPVVIANLINLLLFICLLGAIEIVPLLYSLVMGRAPLGMSGLGRAAVSPVVDVPVVSHTEPLDVEVKILPLNISSNIFSYFYFSYKSCKYQCSKQDMELYLLNKYYNYLSPLVRFFIKF